VFMRLSALAFLMILTTVMLSGCGQQTTASLEDKGSGYYGRQPRENRIAYVPIRAQSEGPQPSRTTAQAYTTPAPFATKTMNSLRYTPVASNRWQWPVNGRVIQNFGPQRDGVASQGITIAAAEGDPIRAAQTGEVAYVGENVRDYGNMVILRHADGTLTAYSHARAITVTKGQQVAAGSVLGFVGQTGSAKTPQLHFAVREGARAVDPLSKLPHEMATN
jgi:murein DD-endopeptidase MepM/ murein hydrolase activator NlpD